MKQEMVIFWLKAKYSL